MTTLDPPLSDQGLQRLRKGPVTARRQRRTVLVYSAICLLGAAPLLLGAPASWQAAGVGLWAPGAGFLAAGGWTALLFPLTLAVFALSLIAWFWAGMVMAPVIVWFGSAALSSAVVGQQIWSGGPILTALSVAGVALAVNRATLRSREQSWRKAAARQAFVPASLAEVAAQTASPPDPASREMSREDLSALRYLLDRALQPIASWDGFDDIEPFQTGALRYQLNHMGLALATIHGAYTPNFQGYMGQAQRNLIEKYLQRKVWGYWIYESCWGHLNFTNWDPADRDNVMLTGWFGMHVGAYMLNSGDRRYLQPGSLTFRLNSQKSYRHDLGSLVGSITSNYARSDFGLFACEPNWIYPICNHYGMGAVTVHEALCGTGNVARYLPGWLEKLDTEFTDESGSIIGLKSEYTGISLPFPSSEVVYAAFHNAFAPARARMLWAVARRELAPAIRTVAGEPRLILPGEGFDIGNYRTGHHYSYAAILLSAREFGEDLLAEAAQNSLDACSGREEDTGVLRYVAASNSANTNAILGRVMRTGDFRRAIVEGPPKTALQGPMLDKAAYPDVLVARAFSDGRNLELVLHPGRASGEQSLGLARLVPHARYLVSGAEPGQFTASPYGTASLTVDLRDRTVVEVAPLERRQAEGMR
ncbi:hypothetical protein [Bradyrhizobium sp. CCBAU 53338]|uniref:linalool dehydratase/isomerase domain-containing protein n=1 Tax=Bradyrhizobium sp. CCBAU 53338 TaxID=1325111 RepID=UPI00188C50B0|nr:hypothetical protein [Bradyrhizobium sp. CCBAU 53338]QOZ51594.1 hypothetical protein XH90_09510 [Bradyrhizobium sp. CCBAU 53338]